ETNAIKIQNKRLFYHQISPPISPSLVHLYSLLSSTDLRMKKANRRSKRTSASDTPSPSKSVGRDNQQQSDDNRIHDLEKENRALRSEVEEFKLKLGNESPASSGKVQKLNDGALQKLQVLEEQVMDLKKKLNAQSQFSTQKQKTAGRQPEDVIQRLKAQKVQLLCKIKLDSVQFRLLKASLEKEVLQLKKDQRKNEYEIRKLLALNNRQKLVLQRKQEEASAATRRLNDFIESRKSAYQRSSGAKNDASPGSQGVEIELKVAERVEEIRSDFERQMEEMAEEVRKYEEEAEMLRQENFRFMLQEKEVDCMARDTELKDLKEEVFKLSTMVNQMPLLRARPVHVTKPQDGNRAGLFEVDSETCNIVPSITKRGGCCSCSKKSLCKTSKCECRAAKGSCGERCGCTTSKCSNRKGLAKKDNSSIQSVIAQDVVHSAVSGTSSTSPVNDRKISQGPIRQPFCEIANVQDSTVEEETKQEKRAARVVEEHPTMSNTDNVQCPKLVAEKAATPPDVFRKLTRAMRSAIMK
ncbi:Kinesin-like protein KIN-4C, partial [Linum grandiflorum]